MAAYQCRCAVTGCAVESVLEAAQIIPYNGAQTNVTQNGLLLRADVHTLFDLGLINVKPDFSIEVFCSLESEEYQSLSGKKISLPQNQGDWPSAKALRFRIS